MALASWRERQPEAGSGEIRRARYGVAAKSGRAASIREEIMRLVALVIAGRHDCTQLP